MRTVLNIRAVLIFVARIYRTMNAATADIIVIVKSVRMTAVTLTLFLLFQPYFIKQIAFPIISRYLTLRR